MIYFAQLYIKGFFVETMRSLFSRIFTIGNSCGELHKQRTLPYLVAPHCDKCIDGDRKNPSNHTLVTKQKWQSQTKTSSFTKEDVKQLTQDKHLYYYICTNFRETVMFSWDQLLSIWVTKNLKDSLCTVPDLWETFNKYNNNNNKKASLGLLCSNAMQPV